MIFLPQRLVDTNALETLRYGFYHATPEAEDFLLVLPLHPEIPMEETFLSCHENTSSHLFTLSPAFVPNQHIKAL